MAVTIKGGEGLDWVKEAERLKFDEGKSWGQVARLMWKYFPDLTEHQVFNKVRDKLRQSPRYKPIEPEEKEYKCSVEYKSDGTLVYDKIIEVCENEDMTPEFMLKAHGLDPCKWDIISYRNNYWHSQIRGGKRLVMYQSKLTVKPNKEGISLEDTKKHFETFKSKTWDVKPIKNESNKMYEINLADLHLGKLCWNRESGENYDYKIAKERFNTIIQAEIGRIRQQPYEKILFVWCNDFFNSDGISNATTGGTAQSVDIRWQKMFLVGCELLVEAIENLSQYAPVETFYIASNHSRQVEFYAINYLYAWFKDNPNVKVDLNCKSRYYVLYGNTLLGFSHSYYEKKNNLHALMSVEVPELWAKSKYREYHLGHIHSEKVEEKGSIVFRWLPSVTGTDGWHYDSGFVGAVKRSYSFVWDKEKGLESMNCTTIEI